MQEPSRRLSRHIRDVSFTMLHRCDEIIQRIIWPCERAHGFPSRTMLHWRQIRAGFWSHRDDLYLRSVCKRNAHHLAARRERKTKKENKVENDAFAASLAATFRCLFLLAFAVHKATREVARNQQPSLNRW